jgi:hypothetical protein
MASSPIKKAAKAAEDAAYVERVQRAIAAAHEAAKARQRTHLSRTHRKRQKVLYEMRAVARPS